MTASKPRVGAILLGAGFARRFGCDKRTAPLGNSTVAETTLDRYAEAFDELRLVVRTEDDALAELAAPYATIIKTEQAHLGMGHSLAAGFEKLPWQWAFVGLLDMPFVKVATLRRLKQHAAFTQYQIIRPQLHPSTDGFVTTPAPHGHPIGFHSSLFDAVAEARGDAGARDLLKSQRDRIENVLVADAGVIKDIDHPLDLAGI